MRLRPAMTPRDRLEHLLDYIRRAYRYWWVAIGLTVVGGALTVLYSIKVKPVYQSSAVLVYQPKIQSVVLSGHEQETVQRNIGDRYRELMLSHDNLVSIVSDPDLSPDPSAVKQDRVEEAIDALRLNVMFESRGANTFRITYGDVDKKRAQKVTARLADLLIGAENGLRTAAAEATVKFARDQKQAADDALHAAQKEYSEFLGKHPEFAKEDSPNGGAGAAILAHEKDKNQPTGNPRLLALERQADRIRAILATPEGQEPPPPPPAPKIKTAEQIQAQAAIDEAQREVNQLQRKLEEARRKFGEQYPDVINAKADLEAAQGRLATAKAAYPPDLDTPDVVQPGGKIDRDKLGKELADLNRRIDAEQARQGAAAPSSDDAKAADAIVNQETEFQTLKRAVDEKRVAAQTLADALFRANLNASKESVESDANLVITSPAFEPGQPKGKGKRFIVMVGLVVFGGLGAALALGLAILDDRVYRRGDIEKLDLAPVLAVIPRARARRRWFR